MSGQGSGLQYICDVRAAEGHQGATTAQKPGFRADINGLRTLAIVPVVLIHAGVPWLPGGFVGVDVFFVISGFLIIGHLYREAESGRIRLFRFWARRLRRLFPMLALVTLATLIAGAFVLSPLELPGLATQAGATLISLSNMLFARDATDYFGHEVQQSPLLHTWSLGVEEQFYIVMPLVLLAIAAIAARRWTLRAVLTVALVVAFAGSLAVSAVMSSISPFWAFYTLPTRAWEFAIGGLIALALARFAPPRLLALASVWIGLALVLGSMFVISGDRAFPGLIALLPVVGTALVIFGGTTGSMPSRLLGSAPLQWIGSRSYSWYLWHWPVIVYATILFGSTVWIGLGAGLLALVLAAVSHRLIENPLRFLPRLTRSTAATYRWMGALLAGGVLVAVAVGSGGALASRSERVAPWAAVYQQGAPDSCEQPRTSSGVSYCTGGAADAPRTVMLLGDSHAAQWAPLLSALGRENGFELLVRSRPACPAAVVRVFAQRDIPLTACDAFHRDTEALLADLKPDIVLLANSDSYLGKLIVAPGTEADAWQAGYREIVQTARAAGAAVVAIEDTHRPGSDPAVCVTRPGGSVEGCTPRHDHALAEVELLMNAERVVRSELGVPALRPIEELCNAETCAIESDGVPVFADSNHLSPAWAATQTAAITALITTAFPG